MHKFHQDRIWSRNNFQVINVAKNDRGSSKCNYMPSAPCSLVSWVLFLPLLNSWYFFSLETCVPLKDPSQVAFFSWTSTLGRFWLLIFYGIRELQLWIGAIRVKGVGNQWIIFFFIVPLTMVWALFGLLWVMPQSVRALVAVELKSYIAILAPSKHKKNPYSSEAKLIFFSFIK